MEELETSTPLGELIVGNVVHGAAVNCVVVPFAEPDEWFMKQFLSREAMERYAFVNSLIIKEEKNGN